MSTRRRLERERASEVPDAAELLVALVRAGLTPTLAVRAAARHATGHAGRAFALVVRRLDDGERLADALDGLTVHLGPTARPIADALATTERYGLPLAPLLDQLAADARAARRRAADQRARELPVRLGLPLVVCTLPSFVLLAIVPVIAGALSSLSGGSP
jgi:tight adherence protein C